MPEKTYCPRHSDNSTNLRCGRCETLICHECMVYGPVGVRCRNCAQVRRLPTFELSRIQIIRAGVVSILLGMTGGIIFSILVLMVPALLYFHLAMIIGVGYMIGEGTSFSVNRKKGPELKIVAICGMALAFIVTTLFGVAPPIFFTSIFGVVALGISFYAVTRRF